ncbi:MAG: hypothetical protein GY861_06085 [bacterium]|nr:hypothetical protein [bacterium]
MILAERSARPHLNVSCIDWAFKRMSLAQFAVHALLHRGIYNYFSLFKTKIAPFLHQALIQKKENEEAEKLGREPKQLTNFPTHHEIVSEALKDSFANFKTTLIIAPLKRKLIQEVPLPGPPIKQVKIPTGPVQKIYLQNMDQTLQGLPNLSRTVWADEVEAAETAMEEQGVSDEVLLVPRASVSGESGEATSDRGSQSAPEPPKKKRHRARHAPADIRRKLQHGQEFWEIEADCAVASAKFFHDYRERHRQEIVQGLATKDARHKITYQFGRRIVDPFERKLYQKIPLVTKEDQLRYKGIIPFTPRPLLEFRRSIAPGSSFARSRSQG